VLCGLILEDEDIFFDCIHFLLHLILPLLFVSVEEGRFVYEILEDVEVVGEFFLVLIELVHR